MKTIEFQSKAQNELAHAAVTLLGRPTRGKLVFKAPTGSGKTVMMANGLAALSKKCEGVHSLAILWVAPNKLHEQSHSRLLSVYGATKALACLMPRELSGPDLPDRSVLFLNWDSINSANLMLRRDNESQLNLESYVTRARALGKKVVLVVDESHLHLDSGEGAQVVVDQIIQPALTIEVSATPRESAPHAQVTVFREDVVAAGLIRKRIIVNPGENVERSGSRMLVAYNGTSENLLDRALAKQTELAGLYRAEGTTVAPLVLIQLPDRRNSADALANFEAYLFAKHGLARGKGVAVWLSGDKSPDLADIASNSSSVRVLFFKQAIATGWDCPRAQILVGLREMQSETFTTQVLGRIIRHPEHKHYMEDALNYGYAFTNYEKLELDADTASWMGKRLVEAQQPFDLPFENWTARNTDRRGHLTSEAVALMLAHKSVLAGVRHRGPIMVNLLAGVEIEDLDARQAIGGTLPVELGLKALQERLNRMKADLVRELADQGSGLKYIEKALRDAAREVLGAADEKLLLETILHKDNRIQFELMVEGGVKEFLATQEKALRQFELHAGWSAPMTRFLDLSTPLEGYAKCLYKPVLADQFGKSNVERPFTAFLDGHPAVSLWFKNGDSGKEHFALKYTLDGEDRLFYPDFVVRLQTGIVGIYDTKGAGKSELSTGNMRDTYAKAEALHEYLERMRSQGHQVTGGIIIQQSDGSWWLHHGKNYPGTSDVSAETGWQPFSFTD